MVRQALRPPPDTARQRGTRVDAAGAEGATLPGDHLLPGPGQGEGPEPSSVSARPAATVRTRPQFCSRPRSCPHSCPHSCLAPPQMWEKAIELGKQLARMHESHMFDFMELSELLVRPRPLTGHTHSFITSNHLLCPPAEKTSSVLREHYARHAPAARVLCGGILWSGLPVLPAGNRASEYSQARC